MMNVNAIRPDDPAVAVEHQATGDLYLHALDPEWQRVHKQMGFISPLADLYEALGFYDEEDQSMNINAIQPDGQTVVVEGQATGETPAHVTPEGIRPADQNVTQPEKLSFIPPIRAIRVKSCGNDWVTDIDAILTTDQIRGLSLDSDGVHIYSKERDIHGAYDNVFVPYSNLEALVFYFSSTEEDTEA